LCAFAFFFFFSDAANSAARSSSHSNNNNNSASSEELESLLTVLYHHLLVTSSMPLLESRYSLASFWSAHDYSIAVATTIVHCLHAVVAASYSDSCAHTSRPLQTEKAKRVACVTRGIRRIPEEFE
jgi:hypothetical protein